jgi:hypothetical protein
MNAQASPVLYSGIEELVQDDVIFAVSPEIVEHELGAELVLYDPMSDSTHVLNETAAVAWWLCDGQRNVSEIKAEYSLICGAEQDQGAVDVEEMLAKLLLAGLLKVESSSVIL